MAHQSILNEGRDSGAGARWMKGAGFMRIEVAGSRGEDVYM